MNDDATAPTPPSTRWLEVRFLGSGGTYFRIWIVNLLLMVVTLGFYYPWARVRKLQFFAANTEIDGYPMHFHGVPSRMFGGFAIALAAFILYTLAQNLHPLLSLLGFILFGLVWPWLLRAAMRFRLGNTSWRGIRLAFTGRSVDAYRAVAVPLLALAGVALVVAIIAPFVMPADMPDDLMQDRWLAGATAGVSIASMLLVPLAPYIHYRVVRYQHEHLAFASERSRFEAGPGSFYLIYLVAAGAAMLAIGALVLAGFGVAAGKSFEDHDTLAALEVIGSIAVMALILFLVVGWHLLRSLIEAWLFNLTWSNTRSQHLLGDARLSVAKLFFVRLTNGILIALTLGLFTPFAEVRLARLKRSALQIESHVPVEKLVDDAERGRLSAASDAAADLFDLDIGL
ncbi:MAG: YjgN family protein [Burkholderiaceae bacterium]